MNLKKRDLDRQINQQKKEIKKQNGQLTKEVYGEQLRSSIVGDTFKEVEEVDVLDWRQQGSSSSSSDDGGVDVDDVTDTEPSMDPSNALKDAP